MAGNYLQAKLNALLDLAQAAAERNTALISTESHLGRWIFYTKDSRLGQVSLNVAEQGPVLRHFNLRYGSEPMNLAFALEREARCRPLIKPVDPWLEEVAADGW